MDEFIGVIKLFGGNFAPKGWAMCNGQLLSIAQNTALFSILGTTYGGDGQTTFAVPDLQGRTAIGMGTDKLNSVTYVQGQKAGTPSVKLLTEHLPAHNHSGTGTVSVSSSNATDSTPARGMSIAVPGSSVARQFSATLGFATATPNVDLLTSITTGMTGSSQPAPVMQPYVAMNYIICTQGIFPSRE